MTFTKKHILHGGDYNPEQWLDHPDILAEDIRMLKKSHCNAVSMGIFSWSALEPKEGEYQFQWLADIVENLYQNGISTILATPSGARPKWLADKYPEVLRVEADRRRNLFGGRHNHCYTSPVYREKITAIDRALSAKLGSHPGVILWHISNELGGECHCPYCQQAFREWLKERYKTIEEVNRCWNTAFWSHTYQSFDQIESPSPIGEREVHGLKLDWKRFVTHQTADFVRTEVQAIREGGSTLPVTTNLMYRYDGLNYGELEKEVDIISWDTYPTWHKGAVLETAYDNGMCHDWMRALKNKPFLQMESCPSSTNWQGVSKLKKPGMLFAQSMQAVAHGGDGALYFQIRQSRGSSEKFHGAVIDHYGGDDTRVFREVTEAGEALEKIACLCGTDMHSQAAVIYDRESIWAMEDAQGPRNDGLHYHETVLKNYRALRRLGLNVDVIDMTHSLSGYKVLCAPMCYMFRDGFEKRVRDFVAEGGTLVMSYWSGIADETDRCFLGGTPHGLMDVLGLRSMEIDGLYDWETNELLPKPGNPLGLEKAYTCRYLCDLVKPLGAETVMAYGQDFYAGYPAVTVNHYEKGRAWYIAADAEAEFYEDFYKKLLTTEAAGAGAPEFPVPGEIPEGIALTVREDAENRYLIFQNFGTEAAALPLPEGEYEIIYGSTEEKIPVYGLVVLKQKK